MHGVTKAMQNRRVIDRLDEARANLLPYVRFNMEHESVVTFFRNFF